MSAIDTLLTAYERVVAAPWSGNVAGAQRVWFVVYHQDQERRLRLRLPDFETATRKHGHGWREVDLTDAYARWMNGQEYREAYFAEPEYLDGLLPEFAGFVEAEVGAALLGPASDERTVVAITGVASLFGLTPVSTLINAVADRIRGRLVVFFPGSYAGSSYRLLDARDGWNYLALPITAGALE